MFLELKKQTSLYLVPHQLTIDPQPLRAIIEKDYSLLFSMKKYKVTLTHEERAELETIINKARVAVRKRIHAQILLRADEAKGQTAWIDTDIAEAYDISVETVKRVRQRFVESGMATALQPRAPQENRARKFDGEKEAQLITLACNTAPEGYARWTLQLLADRMVELKYMESISYEAVRNVLKKTNLSLG